jgi:hypothetical protein
MSYLLNHFSNFSKNIQFLVLILSWLIPNILNAQSNYNFPLHETVENSARYRWENKLVHDSLLIDDAENPANWSHNDLGTMTFTTERAIDGTHSIRLFSKTKGDQATKDNRSWGYCSAIRSVDNQNWSKWNRISMWIYPDAPGHKTISTYIQVVNNGRGMRSRDNIILKNQQWNYIVSEFDWLKRDSINRIEIKCRLNGNEPGTSDVFTYDIDHIVLQRVDPDYYLGWNVAPDRISFSHSGYSTGSPKSAIASNLAVNSFSVINVADNNIVLTKPIITENTFRGNFQMLDFSELNTRGLYYLQAGEIKTKPFRIDDQVWLQPLEKALNFYYVLRCGFAVPGYHDASNLDWRATSGTKSLSIVGGWYDAGDLSQGLYNTAEGTYYMFKLAERLKKQNVYPELYKQLVNEATWGLDWVLKTTLHDGQRSMWSVMGWWSNGVVGDYDDPHAGFGRIPWQTMCAAAAEISAYRVLKDIDTSRANLCLNTAEEDWGFAIKELEKALIKEATCESAAQTVLTSIELFITTGKKIYADKALELAPMLLNAQEQTFIPGSNNITGFLYRDTTKTKILHSVFGSGAHELTQIDALSALCEAFPDHVDWMKWYSGVAMYADMYKKIKSNTAPYNMLPSGIYRDDEYLTTTESQRGNMQRQLKAGQRIGNNYVVTALPANDGHFGNLHLVLTQAKGVSIAAHLRGDLDASQLAEQQLEWTLGRNPFSQSFMYGEGYDYIPLYTPMVGNIVGALPVGLPTYGSTDLPLWKPGSNEPSPHEQWIQTVNRFVYLAGNMIDPAILIGISKSIVTIRNERTGHIFKVQPNSIGEFSTTIPQGQYIVSANDMDHHILALSGKKYCINSLLDYTVFYETDKNKNGTVSININACGSGKHKFALRSSNVIVTENEKSIVLKTGKIKQLKWIAKIIDTNKPWYVVVVPNGNIEQRKEAIEITNNSDKN